MEKFNKRLSAHVVLSIICAICFKGYAQYQEDWDATEILYDMDKSWSIGNGCLEANYKVVNVYDGLELNGNTLEVMDATIQVIGGDVTNFGESVDIDNSELIIYRCNSSNIVIYDEVLNVDTPSEYTVRLYPNPATNYINIDVIDLDLYTIYDMGGSLIASGVNKTIDVSHLSEGIYLIKVAHGIKSKVLRFIKK